MPSVSAARCIFPLSAFLAILLVCVHAAPHTTEELAIYGHVLHFTSPRANYSYLVGEVLQPWIESFHMCRMLGMEQVRIATLEEYNFVRQNLEEFGPFWFGARDLGTKEAYRWVLNPKPPAENAEKIGDFLNFYHSVEEGPMALMMHPALGTSLVGVHSQKSAAKMFCQLEV